VRVVETPDGTGAHLVWTDHSDGRLQQVVYVYRDRGITPTTSLPIGAGRSDTTITIEPTVPYCFVVATVVPGSPITHLDAAPQCIRGATADISVPTS
jgi:hypothetical protein